MGKHTPGPWWLHREYSTVYVEGNANDPRVVQEVAAVGPKEGGREQQEADARLIAAAPELLEALRLADAMLAGANMNANVVKRKVGAAIAKATGATP